MVPLALSPCPNDTFLFHAWLTRLVGEHLTPSPTFGDIQQLNEWALERRFPLIKISFSCLGQLLEDYILLPVGSALGFGCGPKLIAQKPFGIEELSKKRIAIPGKETTAHLLFETLLGTPQEKVFCLYHEVADLVRNQVCDGGLIIHEHRFTYEREGFYEIVDLGALWQTEFQLPLPLGGIVAKRTLGEKQLEELTQILQASLCYAWKYPEKSQDFVLKYSQEKDPKVIQQHIALYVNRESESLSQQGLQAISTLLHCGEKRGFYRTKIKYETDSLCYTPRSQSDDSSSRCTPPSGRKNPRLG